MSVQKRAPTEVTKAAKNRIRTAFFEAELEDAEMLTVLRTKGLALKNIRMCDCDSSLVFVTVYKG